MTGTSHESDRLTGKKCVFYVAAKDTSMIVSAFANRRTAVECHACGAIMDTSICRMLSVSQQPTALSNCQHSEPDALTLCLTSIDSFNTAAGHTAVQRARTPAVAFTFVPPAAGLCPLTDQTGGLQTGRRGDVDKDETCVNGL